MYGLRLISILCFSLLLCGNIFGQWDSTRGSGNVKSEDRQLAGFDAIKVSDGIDLYLSQGSTTRVKVTADDNLLPRIRTRVEGNTLLIDVDGSVRTEKGMQVAVTLPRLSGLSASGGSDVNTHTRFTVENLDVDASGGSDISMELTARRLRTKCSGGSDLNLVGSATEFRAEVSGGSDIKARKFSVDNCWVEASGGSDAWIYVQGNLEARASGGSDIHYDGNPKSVKAEGGWASDITKM